jgi:hypothetical protein
LCDLKGHRLPSRPGEPVATKYPMGLPLVTALVMAILKGEASPDQDLFAARIVVAIFGLCFAVACRWFFQVSDLSDWSASLLSLALVWNPLILKHLATSLLSDLPYAALSTIMILRWTRRARTGIGTRFGSRVADRWPDHRIRLVGPRQWRHPGHRRPGRGSPEPIEVAGRGGGSRGNCLLEDSRASLL